VESGIKVMDYIFPSPISGGIVFFLWIVTICFIDYKLTSNYCGATTNKRIYTYNHKGHPHSRYYLTFHSVKINKPVELLVTDKTYNRFSNGEEVCFELTPLGIQNGSK
jgi:hypothetical protein